MIKKLARWLTGRPKAIITIALLLLIPSLLGYIGTRTNYDVLSYLPENVRSVEGEHLLEEPFKAAATSMVIVEGMPPKYTDELLSKIKHIDHVGNAFWISDSLGIQVPTVLFPSGLRDNFFTDDATIMIVQFETDLSSDETMDAIVQIRGLMNERCFVAGMSAMVEDIKELVLAELPIYTVIAVILTLTVLFLSFESYVMPPVFLACIGLAVVYNMGSNIFFGQISYITKAIAAILQLGVTMDYSIFLYRRYEEEKARHENIRDAMAEAMAAAFASLSGSSLTTIAGFLALCAMQFTMGRDMGLVMAKGVVLGILCVLLVLPCFILVLDRQIDRYHHRNLFPDFTGFNRWLLKHRRAWIIIFLLCLYPAYYSQTHTNVYYQISRSLPDSLPSLRSNRKLKESFHMSTEHVVILSSQLDNGALGELEEQLDAVPGISHVLSYHSLIGSGIPDFFLPKKLREIFKSDEYQLMMLVSDFDPATNEMMEQLSAIGDIVYRYDPSAYLTGESAMTEDLRTVFTEDNVTTNYLSIIAIFLIVMVVFRSVTVPAALILAIELAIYINQGLCYWMGSSVSFIAPILISAIQLGATVDYAILVSSRFQEEIRNGHDRMEAAFLAGKTSDASIITSSLGMFSATVGVAVVSRMYLIKEVCMLLARGALISAFIVAFMLPCLLYELEPLFRKTTLNWAHSDKSRGDAQQ
ncbi:MAG: efflux RND transporter permease subunit [Stomatobaculum sp.]